MKVAIFEISCSNHSVMIHNWIQICKQNSWDFEVYTTKEIYQQVENEVEVKDEQLYFFETLTIIEIIKATPRLRQCNVIVITSLQNYFFHYLPLLFLRNKFLLTIHNLNTWFKGGGRTSAKAFLKFIVRNLWLKKTDAIIVNSENMKKYFDKNIISSKTVSIVPFSLRQRQSHLLASKNNIESLSIVYPGMVSKKRKCYKYFLSLAKKNPDITFTLLGRLIEHEGGDEIENEIKVNDLKNVIYYKSFVKQAEFNQVMESASALFSTVNVNYDHQGVAEIYGRTKDSGISYLMAEFAVPLIVNSDFNNLTCLNEGTFYFSNYEELEQIVSQFKSGREFIGNTVKDILNGRKALDLKDVSQSMLHLIENL